MNDNCGEWVESIGVAGGRGYMHKSLLFLNI